MISAGMVQIPGVESVPIDERTAGGVPFFLEPWFVWVFIFLRIAVPIDIGYYRFKHATIS